MTTAYHPDAGTEKKSAFYNEFLVCYRAENILNLSTGLHKSTINSSIKLNTNL